MTRLVLIRHGESIAQVEGFIGGHEGCRGLSELGRQQAESLRDRLLETGELDGAAVVLTSLMARAIETAEILAPAFGGRAAEQRCDFCEMHPGEVDGLTWEEFDTRYRSGERVWDPEEPVAPGAESWAMFAARASRALDAAVGERPGSTVVVVCHGGIVRASALHFLGLPLTEANTMEVDNTSITEWRWPDQTPYDGRHRWVLRRFNDHAHLLG